MSMEKRKKTRELSEEVRHKIVAKHGQSQGCKSLSRDLDVPVSTVRTVIRKFKAHDTVDNLPGRGRSRKLDRRLQRRIVQMVEKAPRSTAKQIQVHLQTQGLTVSTRTIAVVILLCSSFLEFIISAGRMCNASDESTSKMCRGHVPTS